MTEMQHLLLLLQEHLQPLLLRRRHLRLQRHRLRPRLLVKVSFLSFFLDSCFFFCVFFSFWVFCCLCVVSVRLRACVFAVLLCVSVRFRSSHPRGYAFWLDVTKKRVLLARAKSLRLSKSKQKKRGDPERPRPSSITRPRPSPSQSGYPLLFDNTLSFSALELVTRVDLCGEPKRGRNRNHIAFFGRDNNYTFPHQNRFRTLHLILRLDHSYDIKTFTPASRRVIKDELWVFAIASLLVIGTNREQGKAKDGKGRAIWRCGMGKRSTSRILSGRTNSRSGMSC